MYIDKIYKTANSIKNNIAYTIGNGKTGVEETGEKGLV
jgi:hypothetical protein